MRRAPPRVAVWCLTHLAYGKRGTAIVGDLLERLEEGESWVWFWRQTLATLLYGFLQAAREQGASFAAAIVAAAALYFVMLFTNAYVTQSLIHFQSHGLLEMDPHWAQRWGWKIAFGTFALFQTTSWFAVAGWLVTRIHRAQPRVIVFVCAIAVLAVRLPRTLQLAQNLLTHPRFLDYFIWNLMHLILTVSALVACGIWGTRISGAGVRSALDDGRAEINREEKR